MFLANSGFSFKWRQTYLFSLSCLVSPLPRSSLLSHLPLSLSLSEGGSQEERGTVWWCAAAARLGPAAGACCLRTVVIAFPAEIRWRRGLAVRDMNELSPHNSVQPSYGDWVTSGFVGSECEEISTPSVRYYYEQEGQTLHPRSPKPRATSLYLTAPSID